MADPIWRMLPVFLVINDVMTLLNIIYVLISQLPWFYQRPCYLSIFPFMSTLRVIWILPINSKWRQVTSRHYIVSIKLCPEVGRNGEYLIVHNFAGRRMRGFKVTERDLGAPTLPPPHPPHRGRREQNNKPGLNRVIKALKLKRASKLSSRYWQT